MDSSSNGKSNKMQNKDTIDGRVVPAEASSAEASMASMLRHQNSQIGGETPHAGELPSSGALVDHRLVGLAFFCRPQG